MAAGSFGSFSRAGVFFGPSFDIVSTTVMCSSRRGSCVVIIGGRGSGPTRGGLQIAHAGGLGGNFPARISSPVGKGC